MRLYGKKVLRSKVDKRVEAKRETRDAIVWQVFDDVDNRYCTVKVQGSNTLIRAHYPFNWGTKPEYVKPGNSVKINHQGGARGKIEVVGHGQLIPSPVAGGGVAPDAGTAGDAVLTGCKVVPMPIVSDMTLYIETGTYRIDGTTYTLSAMKMSATSDAVMGSGIIMGSVGEVVEIDAAPNAGWYRMDLISVGTDGVVDYQAGVAATTDPQAPAVASNHLKLANVFVYGTQTTIDNTAIDAKWSAATLTVLRGSMSDDTLDWQSESTSVITLSITDQYGVPFNVSNATYVMEFASGNGTLSHAVSATRSEQVSSSSTVTFTYTRDNGSADISPEFNASVVGGGYTMSVSDYLFISLLDSDGDVML